MSLCAMALFLLLIYVIIVELYVSYYTSYNQVLGVRQSLDRMLERPLRFILIEFHS